MEAVTKRELNQHTARVLDLVDGDRDLVVTERGRPRWRISAHSDPATGLDRLGAGYTPPQLDPIPWPGDPVGPTRSSAAVDVVVDEVKGEN